jgi:plasmid stabilization system protein ParE
MTIEFLAIAETELDEAYHWYESQQKNLGFQFLTEIDASLRKIAAYPEAFLKITPDIRRCLVKRFPYGILYGIDSDKIIVVAIMHLHRKPDYWLSRLDR